MKELDSMKLGRHNIECEYRRNFWEKNKNGSEIKDKDFNKVVDTTFLQSDRARDLNDRMYILNCQIARIQKVLL
jgi:hypothetical protein